MQCLSSLPVGARGTYHYSGRRFTRHAASTSPTHKHIPSTPLQQYYILRHHLQSYYFRNPISQIFSPLSYSLYYYTWLLSCHHSRAAHRICDHSSHDHIYDASFSPSRRYALLLVFIKVPIRLGRGKLPRTTVQTCCPRCTLTARPGLSTSVSLRLTRKMGASIAHLLQALALHYPQIVLSSSHIKILTSQQR